MSKGTGKQHIDGTAAMIAKEGKLPLGQQVDAGHKRAGSQAPGGKTPAEHVPGKPGEIHDQDGVLLSDGTKQAAETAGHSGAPEAAGESSGHVLVADASSGLTASDAGGLVPAMGYEDYVQLADTSGATGAPSGSATAGGASSASAAGAAASAGGGSHLLAWVAGGVAAVGGGVGAAMAAGGGKSGGATVAPNLSGVVADGYISGAKVYVDENHDGIAQESEFTGIRTDGTGHFSGTTTKVGAIIIKGGTNIDTGLDNTLVLSAAQGATVVNPLTTLVQNYAATNGVTAAQAEAAVKAALGLSGIGQSLNSYDPLAVADKTDATALTIQKAAAQIAAAMTEAERSSAGLGDHVLNAITNLIGTTFDQNHHLDLSNASDLSAIQTEIASADASAGTSFGTVMVAIDAATTAVASATTLDPTAAGSITNAQRDAAETVNDTAAHLAANAGQYITGKDVAVSDISTLAQLATIHHNTSGAVHYGAIADTVANIQADHLGAGYSTGHDVVVTDGASIAELTAIDAYAGTVYVSSVRDTIANLQADQAGAGYCTGHNVTVTGAASIAQLAAVDAYAATVTATSVADQAATLAANAGGYLAGSVNVTVTDSATLAQLALIDSLSGGALTYAGIVGSADELTANAGGYLSGSHPVTVIGTATVAQISSIDALTTGALSYSIADSAANLLACPASVISAASAVAVSGGAAGALTLAQHDALLALTTDDTWTYSIADSASNLLSGNAGVLGGATAVTVAGGAAGPLTLAAHDALVNLTTVDTWSYSISDSAANLLSGNAATIGGAAAVTVAGGAADTLTLAAHDALIGLTTVDNWSYSISDSAANISAGNAATISGAAAVTVAGGAAGTLTLAAHDVLISRTSVDSWSYSISDSAANLLAGNPATISGATAVTVAGGAAGILTLAQHDALAGITTVDSWSYSISDSATNLLAGNPATISGAAAVTVAGGAAGTLTLAAHDALIGLTTVDSWSYSISDSATSLLAGNPATISEATAVTVAGGAAGTLTLAAHDALTALTTVDTWSYSISDNATNLLAGNPATISGATAVTVAGGAAGTLTLAAHDALVNLTTVDTWSYGISDSAANLLAGSPATISGAASVTVAGGAAGTLTLSAHDALANITTVDTWSYSISDSAANLLAGSPATISGAAAVTVAGGAAGTLTLAAHDALANITTVDTWSYSISDSAANLLAGSPVTISGAAAVTVAGGAAGTLTLAAHDALANLTTVDTWSYSISDSAANLLAGGPTTISGAAAVTVAGGAAGTLTLAAHDALSNITTVDTWSYSISDSAANLLAGSPATISGAAAVTVAGGAAGTLTLAAHDALVNITTVDTWSYSVSDSAANLLAGSPTTISGAASVTVAGGAAGTLTLAAHDALANITTVDTWSYSISDSAANLLAGSPATISGAAAVTVAGGGAGTLTLAAHDALANLTTVDTWSYSISDSAANLLAGSPATISGAAAVTVAGGGAGTLTLAAHDALANITTVDTWSYSISDSAGNLLAGNAATISGATAVTVAGGTAGTLTLAAHDTLVGITTLDSWSYSIDDTAAHLLSGNAATLSGAAAVTVTGGTAGTLTLAAHDALAALTTVDSWNYSIDDTAAHLLSGNGATISGAIAVTVTGGAAGTLSLAAHDALAALTTVDTWSYNIDDTAAHLLSGNASTISGAAAVTVTGAAAGAVTLAQHDALVALTTVDSWSYSIDDTAAHLLSGNASTISGAAAVTVAGGTAGTLTISQHDTLAGLTTDHSWSYSIDDTAAQLLSGDGSVIAGASAVTVTGGTAGVLTLADHDTLIGITTDDSWSYSIDDSAAHLLVGNAATISGAAQVTVTGADAGSLTLAQHDALIALTTVDSWSYDIDDSAAHLLAGNAATINGASAVTVSGGNAGILTLAQNDALIALTTDDSWSYSISDTASTLLSHGAGEPLASAVSVAVTAGAAGVLTLADHDALAGLTTDHSWSYSIDDTAAQLLSGDGSVIAGASAVTVTGGTAGILTLSDHDALAALTTDDSWSYSIDDSAAQLLAGNGTVISGASAVTVTAGAAGVLTLAQHDALIGLTTDDSWNYDIDDSAAHLLAGSAATISGAAEVTVTSGAAGVLTLAQHDALIGLTTDDSWSYSIDDSAAHLLAGNALTISGASAVTVTSGTAGVLTLASHDALAALTTDDSWSYSIDDTAAHLLSGDGSVIAGASAVTVTSGTAGVLTLADHDALIGLTTDDSWSYSIDDTAAQLLAGNGNVISGASAVTVTSGTAGVLTLAQHDALIGLTTDDSWSYSIEDSAAHLLAGNALTISGASAVTVTSGTAGVLTLASHDALAALTTDDSWSYRIDDTAANLLSGDGSVISGASAVTVTSGTAGVLTLADHDTLIGITTDHSWSYSIDDSAAHLLSGDASTISGGAAVTVTGGAAGTLTLADHDALIGLTTDDSWSYNIDDSAAHLLAGNAATITGAAAVTVTGGAAGALTIAQHDTLAGLTTDDSWGYSISDSASSLLSHGAGEPLDSAASVAVTAGAAGVLTLADHDALIALTTDDSWSYSINDSASHLLAGDAGTINAAAAVTVTAGAAGTLTLADHDALAAITTDDSWSYDIDDSAANLLSGDASTISGAAAVTVTGAAAGTLTLAEHDALAALTTVDSWSYNIDDSAAHLLAGNASTISGAAAVTVSSGAAGVLTLADHDSLAALTTDDSWSYDIDDSAAHLLAGNASTISGAGAVTVTAGAAGTLTLANHDALIALTTDDSWSYSIDDTVGHLLSGDAGTISGASAVTLTGGAAGVLNVADHAALLGLTTDDSWSYSIVDTVAHLTGEVGDLSGAASVTVRLAANGSDADLTAVPLDNDVTAIDLNGVQATLTVAQALLNLANGTAAISDTGAHIGGLTAGQIATLADGGIVTGIDAVDNTLQLSAAQALAVAENFGQFAGDDALQIVDSAANIQTLNSARISEIIGSGPASVLVDSTDNVLTLSASQAKAYANNGATFSVGDIVTLSDTAINIQSLTAVSIDNLAAAGVDLVDSSTNALNLTVTNANAFANGGILFASNDVVTVRDTQVRIDTLDPTQIASLAASGVKLIDNSAGSSITVSVAQDLALKAGGIGYTDSTVIVKLDGTGSDADLTGVSLSSQVTGIDLNGQSAILSVAEAGKTIVANGGTITVQLASNGSDADLSGLVFDPAVTGINLNGQTAILTVAEAVTTLSGGGSYSVVDSVVHLTGEVGDLSGATGVTVKLDGAHTDLTSVVLDGEVATIDLNGQAGVLTVAEAGLNIINTGAATSYTIRDTADNLAHNDIPAGCVVSGVNVSVTDPATPAQLTALDAANGGGTVSYAAVTDTAGNLAADALAGNYVKAGHDAIVTTTATVQQLTDIDAPADTVTYTTLTDSAANLAADAVTHAGAGTYVAAGHDVTLTGTATVQQLTDIDNAADTMTYTTVTDSAANLAADAVTHAGAGTYVTAGHDAVLSGTGTVQELTDIDNAADTMTYTTVTDSAANLAADAVTHAGAGTYVTAGHDAILSGTASVQQLTDIDAAADTVTYTTVTDSAVNLVADAATHAGAGTYVTAGHDAVLSGTATVQQLTDIDAAADTVNYTTVTDSATNLAADALTHAGAGTYVTSGHDVILNSTATVQQLTDIDAAADGVTYTTLTDSAANLAADAVTNAGAGTYVAAGHDVTVNTTATVQQLADIDNAADTMTYTTVTDSAGNLAADAVTHAGAGTYVTAGHDALLTGTGTVQELTDIDNAADTMTYTTVTDSAANLAADAVTHAGAGTYVTAGHDAILSGTASVQQLTDIDNAADTVTYTTVTDSAVNLAADAATHAGAGTFVTAGHDAVLSGTATVQQLTDIDAAADTVNYTTVTDSATNLAADALTHAGAGTYVTSGHDVILNTTATVQQLTDIDAAADSVTYTTLTDSAANLAADAVTHAGAGTYVAAGHDATLSGTATVQQLTEIDAAADTVTYTTVTDSAANLAADALTHAGAGTYVTSGHDAILSGTASVQQLTDIDNAADTVTYTTVTDSAANLAADAVTHAGAGTYVASGHDAILSGTATVQQLTDIDNAADTVTYTTVTDSATNLAADAVTHAGAGTYVASGHNAILSGTATVQQLTDIDNAADTVTYTTVTDSATNLAADAVTHAGAGTYVASGHDAILTGTATVQQLTDIDNAADAVTYTTVTDSATNLAADAATHAGAGSYVTAGHNVTVSGSATVQQLTDIDAAADTVTYTTVTGSAANLAADALTLAGAGTYVTSGHDAILSGTATVQQLTDIDAAADTVTYTTVTDSAANLAADALTLAGAGTYVASGHDAILTGTATVQQLTDIDAAADTVTYTTVTDSATNLAADAVTHAGAGTYVASGHDAILTGTATVQQLTDIDNAADTVTYTTVTDSATNLAADAVSHAGAGTYVTSGHDAILTGTATVQELTDIDAAADAVSYTTVTDSATNLAADAVSHAGAGTYVTSGHDAILSGTATVQQLTEIDAAADTVTYTTVTDSAANLASDAATHAGAGTYVASGHDVTLTGTATVQQLTGIDAAADTVNYTTVTDSAVNLAADAATHAGAGTYVASGHDVTLTGSATVQQLTDIDAAADTVNYTTVTDSATNLAADAITHAGAGTYVASGHDVTVSGTATIQQLTDIDAAADTVSYTSITDNSANLVGDADHFITGNVDVTVTDGVSVAGLGAIDSWTNGTVTAMNLTDGIANLVPAGVASAYIGAGSNVTVSDTATVAQLQTIDDANGGGTLSYGDLADSAANLAADAATHAGAGTYVTAGHDVTLTGTATVQQLTVIDAAGDTMNYTTVTDSATNLASDAATHAGAGTYVTSGHDAILTGTASVQQLTDIDAAADTVTYTTVTDSAVNLATDAATVGGAGTYVTAGHDAVLSGSASVQQLADIDAAADTVSYTTVTDSAVNLAADAATHAGAGTYVTAGHDAILTGTATVQQLTDIDAAADNVSYTTLTDSAVNLAADAATHAGAGTYVSAGHDVTLTGTATVQQLAAIDAAADSVTYTTLTDSAANLAADAVTNAGAGTYVAAGHDVTVTGSATVQQLGEIDGAADTVTYTTVTDSAANLAADALTHAGAGTYVSAGHNVTVTGSASIQELTQIDTAAGTVSYGSITDTEANLTANAGGYIVSGINLTVTDAATLTQLAILDGMNGAGGTVVADMVSDTLANLSADAATNGGTGTYVTAGHAVTVIDTATIAQLAALDALGSVGTVNATSVSDTLGHIQSDHQGAGYTTGHNVTVTDAASVADLAAIDLYAGTVTASHVTDTLGHIQSDHGGTGYTTGHDVTVSDSATIAELTAVDVYAAAVTAFSIHDSAANLAADAGTNGGTGTYVTAGAHVTVDDAATVAQITAIHAADGTGTLSYSILDSAAHIQTALDGNPALALVQNAVTVNASDDTLHLTTNEFDNLLGGTALLASDDTVIINESGSHGLALHNYGGNHTIVLGGDQNGSYFVSLGDSGDTTIHLGGTGNHTLGATDGVQETFILDAAQNGGSVITGLSGADGDQVRLDAGISSLIDDASHHLASAAAVTAAHSAGDWSFSGGVLTYFDSAHNAVESLTLVGSFTTLTLQGDGHTFHAG